MKNSLFVSVIIPALDRGWILREAIESVLAQDYDNFELIVVNDGSSDDTERILAEYGGRITVLEQANQGVSAARNNGVAHANGTLIAFLDSDDVWLPEKLSMQVDFFRRNPETLICQTQETWVRKGRRVNAGKRHQKQSGMFFERSLELCLVSPSAVMIILSFGCTARIFFTIRLAALISQSCLVLPSLLATGSGAKGRTWRMSGLSITACSIWCAYRVDPFVFW